MPTCRVVLSDDVFTFLADQCTASEQDILLHTASRWEQVGPEQVVAEMLDRPDAGSEPIRWFRFGDCIAILKVEFDARRVIILECQRRGTTR